MKEPEARRNFDERNERKRHKSMLFRGIVTFLFAFDFFFQKSPRHKRENLYQKSFLELEVISDLFSLVLVKLIKSSDFRGDQKCIVTLQHNFKFECRLDTEYDRSIKKPTFEFHKV